MKQKITCFCDNIFEVEVPEEIDLDNNSNYLDEILNGIFFNFICPGCGKNHKPEFPLKIHWPSKKICFEVYPELQRGEFYLKKTPSPKKGSIPVETIIGYPEMADRLSIIRDGLDPVAIEAIKYLLHLKAEEQYPDDEPEIWYFGSGQEGSTANSGSGEEGLTASSGSDEQGSPETSGSPGTSGSLEFHIHGIRKNEVAVMKVPITLYKKTLEDYNKNPKSEFFTALRVRTYLSVKNTMRPDELK